MGDPLSLANIGQAGFNGQPGAVLFTDPTKLPRRTRECSQVWSNAVRGGRSVGVGGVLDDPCADLPPSGR